MLAEGRTPKVEELERRGLSVLCHDAFHAKVLAWGDSSAVITSFNWLASTVNGARPRGAELGVLIEGDGIAKRILEKLSAACGIRI
jgi:phosphatidylserine/phosphatidylglycerophosphate/cardiolipin synthase-like enzyme